MNEKWAQAFSPFALLKKKSWWAVYVHFSIIFYFQFQLEYHVTVAQEVDQVLH